jgi:hypothetical protein
MKRRWLSTGTVGLGLIAGCLSAEKAAEKGLLRDDFCKDAIPIENGTYLRQWNAGQIAEGDTDLLLISEHEWYDNGPRLGPDGRRHTAAIAQALLTGAEQAVVEAADVHVAKGQDIDAAVAAANELNELRRQHVVTQLQEQGVADADLRVVIKPVDRVGLRGIEAPRTYNQLLQGGNQQGQGGRPGGGGGGLGGGGIGGGAGGGLF